MIGPSSGVCYGVGPIRRAYLPLALSAAVAGWFGCGIQSEPSPPAPIAAVRVERLAERLSAWSDPRAPTFPGGVRLFDGVPPPTTVAIAVVRSILADNPRLSAFEALVLATAAIAAARRSGLDPAFFCATILQESSFEPDAFSPAGAVGIAQFTIGTADAVGIDPFDWRAALGGSAALLASYVHAYRGRYPDPYAAALAAYNAGPGAVVAYHGIPPYSETRDYIATITGRWARIVADRDGRIPERPAGVRGITNRPGGRR
ncbi:MAG: lytic transglycosylase domain-containing protein [Vulcanimicrobiaceae bacterium]